MSTESDGQIDFARLIGPVARQVLGAVNPTQSSRDELRFGTHGSTAVKVTGPRAGTWYDHEADIGGGVLDLLRHRLGLVNGEAMDWLKAHGHIRSERIGESTIIATYDYFDEHGELLYQVCRLDPKSFRQRRPNPEGKGWIWKMAGIRRVPYCLPELLASTGLVFIVEGEKDCHSAQAVGLIATTNPGGAGKWRPDFAPYFTGRRVVVLPHNDAAGQEHGAQVASMLRGHAESILVIDLPGLPEKGDLTDWLDAGGTASELRNLADQTPLPGLAPIADTPPEMSAEYWSSLEDDFHTRFEVEDAPASEAPALWVETDAWDEAAITPRPWIARGYLMRGAVTVLSGPGSAGKSSIVVGMSSALALGSRWNRFAPVGHDMRSIVYNVEDDAMEQRRRFSAVLRQFGCNPSHLAGKVLRIGPHNVGTLIERDGQTGKLRFTPTMDQIIELIEQNKPDVTFLDPFTELHNAEENDNTAVRAIMAYFRVLAIKHDMSVVILHHARKNNGVGAAGDPDSVRGASAIIGAARIVLTVSVMTDDEAKTFGVNPDDRRDYFRVDGAKSNYAPIEDAEWFRRAEYELENGETVAAAVPWKPTQPWNEFTRAQANQVLDLVAAGTDDGNLYSFSRRGRNNVRWVGALLVDNLGLNEEQAVKLIEVWKKNGLLFEKDFTDEHRNTRSGVAVNDSLRP